MTRPLSATLIFCSVFLAQAQPLEWLNDYSAALEKARQEDKAVMVQFTGSDWYTQGIQMRERIFDTPEFAEFAKQNLVLLEADFLRKSSYEQRTRNERLADEFHMEVFFVEKIKSTSLNDLAVFSTGGRPTVFFVSKTGKKLETRGTFVAPNPKDFIKSVCKIPGYNWKIPPNATGASNVNWLDDYSAAREKARKEDKAMMIHFIGWEANTQDIEMRDYILDTPEFAEFAKQNLVWLEADVSESEVMPRDRENKNKRLLDHVYRLAENILGKYPGSYDASIERLPTFFFIDKNEKVLGARGPFFASTPQVSDFIKWIVRLRGYDWKKPSPIINHVRWLDSYSTALEKARNEDKVVMMHFIGSDWHPESIELRDNVFDTREFAAFADLNLVLMEVDFPKFTELSYEQKKRNAHLNHGFPLGSLVFMNGSDQRLGVGGYAHTGPGEFVNAIMKISGHDWKKPAANTPAISNKPQETKPASATPSAAIVSKPPEAPVYYSPAVIIYTNLAVRSISGPARKRVALINNQTFAPGEKAKVKLGETVVDVECTEIRENSVIVKVGDETDARELKLAEGKKP